MKICAREYKIVFDPKASGASFSAHDGDKGIGEVEIGSKYKAPQEILNGLVHESVEAILFHDGKRYVNDWTQPDDHTRYVFMFDHDYLVRFSYNFTEALMSSGMLKYVAPKALKKK